MVEVAHDHLEAKVLLTQQILNYMVAVVAAVGMVMVAPISKLSLSLSLTRVVIMSLIACVAYQAL
jgi:hypothetical protein